MEEKENEKKEKRHGKSICCIYCTQLSTHTTLNGVYDSYTADSIKFHIGAFPVGMHSGKTLVTLVSIKWGQHNV